MGIEVFLRWSFFEVELCIQMMLLYGHNPPEEQSDSLMGFWLFTETRRCCEEGCKVNLCVFEVRFVPH